MVAVVQLGIDAIMGLQIDAGYLLSTIALADRVLFMQEGRVVASGTHNELLATNTDYEAMVRAYEQEVDG